MWKMNVTLLAPSNDSTTTLNLTLLYAHLYQQIHNDVTD